MKSLSQLKKDKRISDIEVLSADESDSKYFVWLTNGYVIDGDNHMFCANTIAEINQELASIQKEN